MLLINCWQTTPLRTTVLAMLLEYQALKKQGSDSDFGIIPQKNHPSPVKRKVNETPRFRFKELHLAILTLIQPRAYWRPVYMETQIFAGVHVMIAVYHKTVIAYSIALSTLLMCYPWLLFLFCLLFGSHGALCFLFAPVLANPQYAQVYCLPCYQGIKCTLALTTKLPFSTNRTN